METRIDLIAARLLGTNVPPAISQEDQAAFRPSTFKGGKTPPLSLLTGIA